MSVLDQIKNIKSELDYLKAANAAAALFSGGGLLSIGTAALAYLAYPDGYRPFQWMMLPRSEQELVFVKFNIDGWFFDATLSENHESTLEITQNPVQGGASLTDHAYAKPKSINLSIMVSDCMTSIIEGQFSSGPTKSKQAFQVLHELQAKRVPLSVCTRLTTYTNMLIENISIRDDNSTHFCLKADVTMKEVLLPTLSTTTVSARDWTTGSSNSGEVQPRAAEETPTVLRGLEDAMEIKVN